MADEGNYKAGTTLATLESLEIIFGNKCPKNMQLFKISFFLYNVEYKNMTAMQKFSFIFQFGSYS
jgi:hypothetical protein